MSMLILSVLRNLHPYIFVRVCALICVYIVAVFSCVLPIVQSKYIRVALRDKQHNISLLHA